MNEPFVTKINLELAEKLKGDLQAKGFTLSKPEHTLFSARNDGTTLTLYESGKLVIQGKQKDELIHFYIEPEILRDFSYSHRELGIDTTPRIGVDEAGKGDFFGPLCIGALYADEEKNVLLAKMGVKDSKKLADATILKLAPKLKENFAHKLIIIYPEKYNELYSKFKNLNSLLAWGHATAIDHLSNQTKCTNVIIDKFANEYVVESAVRQKHIKLNLTQVHKGEEDLVVAGASILARAAFLEALRRFETQYNFIFPKGASKQVIDAGKAFLKIHSLGELAKVAKMHFKTAKEL